MHIIPALYHIERCVSVIKEDFKNNKRKWELVESETESAFLENGRYTMINKAEGRWKYYKTKSNLKKDQHFMLDAYIDLKRNENSFGHFGLVWGFDDELEYFNRFTMSADGKRVLIMHFEKDHREVFHRFQTRKNTKAIRNRPIRFTIYRIGEYYHFSINGKTIYTAHEYHFARNGSYVGFYVEPGIEISSSFLEIKKIKLHHINTHAGLHQLMNDINF